jgi:hypothetical protein
MFHARHMNVTAVTSVTAAKRDMNVTAMRRDTNVTVTMRVRRDR